MKQKKIEILMVYDYNNKINYSIKHQFYNSSQLIMSSQPIIPYSTSWDEYTPGEKPDPTEPCVDFARPVHSDVVTPSLLLIAIILVPWYLMSS